MANTEKPLQHVVAEEIGAAIDMWSAPGVAVCITYVSFGIQMMQLWMPKTAPSSFGKEKN